MKWLIPLCLLSGCATTHFGEIRDSDTDCGYVRNVDVRIQAGVSRSWLPIINCTYATRVVEASFEETGYELVNPWTVVFTEGYVGLAVNGRLNAYFPRGMTYTANRVIWVMAGHPWVFEHELGHAYDLDHSLPNHRDHQ